MSSSAFLSLCYMHVIVNSPPIISLVTFAAKDQVSRNSPVILWFEVKLIATEFLSLPNDR